MLKLIKLTESRAKKYQNGAADEDAERKEVLTPIRETERESYDGKLLISVTG